MTIENSSTTSPAVVTEAAITAAADKLIYEAAQKNGLTVDQIPQAAKDDALKFARESVEHDVSIANNPYHHLYLQEKAEKDALRAQLGAVRENRNAVADTRTVVSMERVRDLMGRDVWFQLTEAGKLTALGVDPAVDRVQLRTLFGRNTDTAAAVDFAKASPYTYRQYREAAKALDITGK